MDIVVYLALAVLAAVFLFSLFILIVMCHRKHEYNRLFMAQSLRFSKLQQDNLEDVIQLGPHISQQLNSNQWVDEVSGILQNCVAVLKLCHLLTDNLSKIPLNQINPQLNEIICQATSRVVPRFDILLHSLAAKNVDIRVLEARVSSLITACWALVAPFYLLNPKYKDPLGSIVEQMEQYCSYLQLALDQVESNIVYLPPPALPSTSSAFMASSISKSAASGGGRSIATNQTATDINTTNNLHSTSTPQTPDNNSHCVEGQTKNAEMDYEINGIKVPMDSNQQELPLLSKKRQEKVLLNGDVVALRSKAGDPSKEPLTIADEAPADPSCS